MPDQRRYSILILSQVAIATSAIFARFALQGTGPVTLSALRLSIASLILVLASSIAAARRPGGGEKTRPHVADELWLILAGVALGAHFAAWMASLNRIPVALSTLLVVMTPLWNALYERVVQKKRRGNLFWLAIAMAFTGLVLVIGGQTEPTSRKLSIDLAFAQGALLSISGGILMSGYMVLVELVGRQRQPDLHYSTSQIILRTYPWAAVFLVLWASVSGETFPSGAKLSMWGGILGLALVPQLVGHTLLNISIRQFNPSIVAFVSLLEPVLSGIFAYFAFSETISPSSMLGGTIILSSLVMALVLERRSASKEGH